MRTRTLALMAALTLAWGCGGASEPGDATAPPAAAASPDNEETVDRARIDSCAGFSADKAAGMLGMPVELLEVQEQYVERFRSQMCRYWSQKTRVGPGIDILLNPRESRADAARMLASLRSEAPAVDRAGGNLTGAPAKGPAVIEFEGIGDEAIWDVHTGGITLRVRNVIATIHASAADTAKSDRDADQIALERRAAEEVARGLAGK